MEIPHSVTVKIDSEEIKQYEQTKAIKKCEISQNKQN